MRALGREGGTASYLEIPGAAEKNEEKERERAKERDECPRGKRLLEPPFETRPVEGRRIRCVKEYLIGSYFRISPPLALPQHHLMILALKRLRTKSAVAVAAAPKRVKSGTVPAEGV